MFVETADFPIGEDRQARVGGRARVQLFRKRPGAPLVATQTNGHLLAFETRRVGKKNAAFLMGIGEDARLTHRLDQGGVFNGF